MTQATEIMTARQKAMSLALLAVRTIARRAQRSASRPDFTQLKSLMDYVERFPQRLHQRDEEEELFRALEKREPGMTRTLARLRREHMAMRGYGARLRTALDYWEKGDPKAAEEATLVADDYVRYCRQHARVEQRDVLPAARKALSDAEWARIDRAFAAEADPLAAARSGPERALALQQIAHVA